MTTRNASETLMTAFPEGLEKPAEIVAEMLIQDMLSMALFQFQYAEIDSLALGGWVVSIDPIDVFVGW